MQTLLTADCRAFTAMPMPLHRSLAGRTGASGGNDDAGHQHEPPLGWMEGYETWNWTLQ